MKKCSAVTLKYAAIGFASIVIATATFRAWNLAELAPMAVGAVMLSLLVACTEETRKA
jgi:uncharacterized membrane protein